MNHLPVVITRFAEDDTKTNISQLDTEDDFFFFGASSEMHGEVSPHILIHPSKLHLFEMKEVLRHDGR